MKWMVIRLILALLGGHAEAGDGGSACITTTNTADLAEDLSLVVDPPRYEVEMAEMSDGSQSNATTITAYRGRTKLGLISYHRTSKVLIEVDFTRTEKAYRKQGVSRALFDQMLERERDAQVIEGTLMQDNLKAAFGDGKVRRQISFFECVQAVKNTPAYRAASAFGFTRITECYTNFFAILVKFAK
jgi:predicted GNAT family acetyltransferase